jgi:hypothetical protein
MRIHVFKFFLFHLVRDICRLLKFAGKYLIVPIILICLLSWDGQMSHANAEWEKLSDAKKAEYEKR